MINSKFLLTAISITALMSVSMLNAQDLKGDESKSMEKYSGVKGENGIIAPELRLSVE